MKDNIFRKIGKCIISSAIYAYCKVVYRVKIIGKENNEHYT